MNAFTYFRKASRILWLIAVALFMGTSPIMAQSSYCIPTYSTGCYDGDDINNFWTTGAQVNISNLNSGCSNNAYGDFTATHSMTATLGSTFTINVNTSGTYDEGYTIWIDFNGDGDFADPGEEVWNSGTSGTSTFTGTITIPFSALPGTTRMRVRGAYNSVPADPCASGTYGETEDYTINIVGGASLDAGVYEVTAPTLPAAPGSQPVIVTIMNYGSTTLTSATINWSINGVNQTPFSWTGSLALGNISSPATIGTVNIPTGNNTIKVWTTSPNGGTDGDASNDTASFSALFISPLNGTYTIGGSTADFATIADAVNALNSAGVGGAVIFNINSGTYTEQIVFTEILGASDVNTITFKSASNDPDDVTWEFIGTSAENFTIQLNGADYLRFKYLTIKNNHATYGRVIELTGGAHYNIFEGNKMFTAGTSTTTTSCIYDGNTLNNHNKYLYNYMEGGYYTMYLYGVSSSSWEKGTIVKGNEIVGSYYYPIYLYYCDSVEVLDNYVHSGVASYSYGISVYYVNNYYNISGNRVVIENPSSASYGIRDAYGNYTSYNANPTGYGLVSNNMVSILGGAAANYGFYSYYGNGTKTVYNTALVTSTSATGRALYQANAASNTLGQEYYNNIWINNGGGYAAYYTTIAQVTGCDYNAYYTSGPQIAYWSAARATLTDLQTASSKDANSISALPAFVSEVDLHNTDLATYQVGTPIAGVNFDFDGDPRHATTPCMGADEYILYNNDAGVIDMVEPIAACAGSSTIKVAVKNFGLVPMQGVNVHWSVNNSQGTTVYHAPSLAIGQVDTVTLGSYTFANNVIYNMKFWTSNPGGVADQNNSNDTLTINGFQTSLSGNYTIGTASSDFLTIQEAVNALSTFGVCGAVTFDVVANTGPFVGGFNFANILGTSATNTITFNGNNNEINESTETYLVGIQNSSYITLNGFRIIVANPQSNSKFGVYISNSSHHITITNNYIDVGMATTASTAAGIVVSGSPTGATTAGDNGSYITVSNNEIVGGYYGVTMTGVASYLNCVGNVLTDNIIRDFYYYATYFANNDNLTITGNDIHRLNRGTVSSFYGAYITTTRNAKIKNNRIHDGGTGSYTTYPIYVSTSVNTLGNETEIVNNAIYNFNTTTTTYGIYFAGTREHIKVYHNTVYLNVSAANTGTIYGIYFSGAPNNHDVKNNLINLDGGGTGTKYFIYVATTSTTFQSDYNTFFSTITTGTNNFGYWSAARTDINAWQTASSQDANSMTANPVLANPAAGNVIPLSGTIDNMGTPVGVLTDLDNNPRSASTPDVGALEFTGIASDIALSFEGSLVPGLCLSNNDSLYVGFTNVIGGTLDFSVNPLTINWNVTGPLNSSGSIIVNTGTLAAGNSMVVGANGVDLSEPGVYSLSAYLGASSINLYQGNDTLVDFATAEVKVPFAVFPKDVFIANNSATVDISVKSPHISAGSFFMTEICHWRGSTTGAPIAGWPSYLIADDYIEITGPPMADLDGITLEQWDASSMVSTYTFPQGTVIGPNGTAVFAVGQMGSSVPVPASYHYHANGSYTGSFGSTVVAGRILKDQNGNIIDAVGYGTYTFPAAAGVTPADWSGNTPEISSAGNKLEGAYTKSSANWVNSGVSPMDPNVVNAGVTVPSGAAITGLTWSHDGVVFATNVVDTTVGPWSIPGVYEYVASYISPCGTLTDTVRIHFMEASVSGDSLVCAGDTAYVTLNLSGVPPFTLINTDGVNVDTFSIPSSPITFPVIPMTSTTYTLIAYADSMGIFAEANLSHTINTIPAPMVDLLPFAPICASEASFALTGGSPAGGIFSGIGVTGTNFNPQIAGPGLHTIIYSYQDTVTLCFGHAYQQIELLAGPDIFVTADHDICPGTPTTLTATPAGPYFASVFFSEYIEGSGNNKAIEIFNGTADTIDLANYRIAQSTNGAGWAYWHTFPVGATLAPQSTWVMVADQINTSLFDTTLADEVLAYPSLVHHNGNDARAIEVTTDGGNTWTIIDIIGTPDFDPGKGWDVAGVTEATADHTLIRKPDVTHGDTSWTNIAGTSAANSQYIVHPVNYFDDLGQHTYNAPLTPTFIYEWSTGATTQSITVDPKVTTTYTVTVTDTISGCGTIEHIVISMKPGALVDLGGDFNVCSDKTATINAGSGFTTYLWSTGATTQTITVDGSAIGVGNSQAYSVTVTNPQGCESSDEVTVTSIDCTGIDEYSDNNKLTFWPNPTDGNFFMKVKGVKGDAMITILNATGQAIVKENLALNGELVKEFHLGKVAPGVYMVRLQTASEIITKQIIVK